MDRKISQNAFTIAELLVAIVVFALGLIAAYSLLQTATGVSMRSRDEIIGGNALRERFELLRNVRDSNWVTLREWDSLRSAVNVVSEDPSFCAVTPSGLSNCRLSPGAYTVENDFSNPGSPIKIRRLSALPDKAAIIAEANSTSGRLRLCLDSKGRYVHDCASPNTKTPYFSYVKISPLETKDDSGGVVSVSGAIAVSGYFVSIDNGYRELDMHTVLTDWKR